MVSALALTDEFAHAVTGRLGATWGVVLPPCHRGRASSDCCAEWDSTAAACDASSLRARPRRHRLAGCGHSGRGSSSVISDLTKETKKKKRRQSSRRVDRTTCAISSKSNLPIFGREIVARTFTISGMLSALHRIRRVRCLHYTSQCPPTLSHVAKHEIATASSISPHNYA